MRYLSGAPSTVEGAQEIPSSIQNYIYWRPGVVMMNSGAVSRNGSIPFTKASACGNDFILIDGIHAPPDIPPFSRRICNPHDVSLPTSDTCLCSQLPTLSPVA